MDRVWAEKLIRIGKKNSRMYLDTDDEEVTLECLRADIKDIDRIERLTNQELISKFESTDALIHKGSRDSLYIIQLWTMMGAEIITRGIQHEVSIYN